MSAKQGIIFLVLFSTLWTIQADRKTDLRYIKAEERLRNKLLGYYDPSVAPPGVTIECGMVYNCALKKDDGSMSLSVMSEYYWDDPRLQWNPTKYKNITTLRLSQSDMWVPDMTLYNNPAGMSTYPSNVIVTADGHAILVLPTIYIEPCRETDKKGYYFCSLRIGSWSYDGFSLMLEEADIEFDTSLTDPNCPFVVSDILTTEIQVDKYPCCEEPYPSWLVEFNIKDTTCKEDYTLDFNNVKFND